MSPNTTTPSPDLALELRHTWHRFVETFEPLRPDLYRYCRSLTRSRSGLGPESPIDCAPE